MGDIDTEMVLWYRPEDATEPRPAYAVDLTTGGSDLGGSVAAALASASLIFQSQNETEYAALLLDKAKGVRGGGGAAFWVLMLSLSHCHSAAPAWSIIERGRAGSGPTRVLAPSLPAPQAYEFATATKALYTTADFNASLLFNSSTLYDDLAWAAGWLYKATKQDAYLSDMYDYYTKHLGAEADISDWK